MSALRAPWCDAPAFEEQPRLRVVVNRDEQRTRGGAHPPREMAYDGVEALHPVDVDGGGTWVAASASGLVMTLLNEVRDRAVSRPRASRGLIIPALLGARSISDVPDRLAQLGCRRFAPFRLLVLSEHDGLEAVADGRTLAIAALPPRSRLVRTSSSVRTADVRTARLRLFHQMVHRASPRLQDTFHGHHWDHDRSASVLMERRDARTVSQTIVEMFAARVRLEYRPVPAWRREIFELPRRT